jgi:hypothetical protein
MKRISYPFFALLLLPVCYGVFQGLWILAPQFKNVPEGSFYFFCGFLGYFAFQWAFFRPIRTYVFGHELTHALAAWMSGGEVKNFHIGRKGGAVTVTKSNLFVALAPYMVPLYALLFLTLFLSVDFFHPLGKYWKIALGMLGGTMGFHAALTVYALKQDQPDLKAAGVLLSGVLIFLGNALCAVLLLGILFPRTVSYKRFFRVSSQETITAFERIGHVVQSFHGNLSRT